MTILARNIAQCLLVASLTNPTYSFLSAQNRGQVLQTQNKRGASSPEESVVLGTSLKEDFFRLLNDAPQNSTTSQALTKDILSVVRQLEKECPTPPAEVIHSLAGPWELLWTAQDPAAPESNRLLTSWINPLENQSYSNKNTPGGRSNPILPREMEEKLEQAGIAASVADFRSTQTIDMATKQVVNVVVVDANLPILGKQRATVTVSVDFRPSPVNPRQIDVKFQKCRFTIRKILDVTIPLGIAGPRGWLRTVYIDHNLRVTRGHKGSVFVLQRISKSSDRQK